MSIAIAAMIHTVGIAVLLNYLLGQFQNVPVLQPIATSELLDADIARQLTAQIQPVDPEAAPADPAATTAVEPGASVIQSVTARIRNYDKTETGPDPLETVRRNAALLERISSTKEIDRMADRLRDAMGAPAVPMHEPNAETPAVNWDKAVQSGGRRIVDGDRVEIHETFVDAGGGASTMIHAREPGDAPAEFIYTVTLLEGGHQTPPAQCTVDEFNSAAERVRPFEVISEFPLLRELHRSAIVPIMQKMSEDEESEQATTQPAAPEIDKDNPASPSP